MELSVRSHGLTALGPMHQAFATLRGWHAMLGAGLLGAFASLAFAPLHLSVALLVSFTGLVWMIDGARGMTRWGRAVFARGWAFGFGYFLVGMYWTAEPFLVEPEKHLIFIWMPLFLMPAGMALIWGAAMAFAASFWSASPSRIFVLSIAFALGELVRGHLFGGFPWNLAGTTWLAGGALSQMASIGGVYWLTLLTVFIMATPAALVDTRDARGLIGRMLPALIAVVAFSGAWAWGSQRLIAPPQFTDQRLVLMDAGVSQSEKWTVGVREVLTQYAELFEQVDVGDGDIVIWPEAALPAALLQTDGMTEAVSALIGDGTLIAGTPRYETYERPTPVWFNSLAVLNRESARSGPMAIYDKHRLVPFGELPAAEIIPFGSTIASILPGAIQRLATDGFHTGPGPTVIYADDVPPFVALICYEGLYPSIPRKTHPRADWMVLVSNDGWFGEGWGPPQHAAQNRYRSIELGLPMARVASRGLTAIIDGKGRLAVKSEPAPTTRDGWRPQVARGALPRAEPPTPYQRFGAAPFWLTLTLFAALAFLAWRR